MLLGRDFSLKIDKICPFFIDVFLIKFLIELTEFEKNKNKIKADLLLLK